MSKSKSFFLTVKCLKNVQLFVFIHINTRVYCTIDFACMPVSHRTKSKANIHEFNTMLIWDSCVGREFYIEEV